MPLSGSYTDSPDSTLLIRTDVTSLLWSQHLPSALLQKSREDRRKQRWAGGRSAHHCNLRCLSQTGRCYSCNCKAAAPLCPPHHQRGRGRHWRQFRHLQVPLCIQSHDTWPLAEREEAHHYTIGWLLHSHSSHIHFSTGITSSLNSSSKPRCSEPLGS